MPIKKKLFNAPFVLSLGSGAGKILSEVPLSDKYYKVAINSSSKDLQLIESKVDITLKCGDGKGSGMSPIKGYEDMRLGMRDLGKVIQEIKDETKTDEIDLIPLIISLGHGFGTGSSEAILETFEKTYKDTIILPFVITPFTWEGADVVKRAYTKLEKLTEFCTCIIISNEEVGKIYSDIGSSYDRINAVVGELISDFIEAMSATDGIIQTVDKSDFAKLFTGRIATLRGLRFKSADEITLKNIKNNMEQRFLKTQLKTFKPQTKLKLFYAIDGKGPFQPDKLLELQEFIASKDYFDTSTIKPLLIERKRAKHTNFLWLESGFKLACDKNIYGIY